MQLARYTHYPHVRDRGRQLETMRYKKVAANKAGKFNRLEGKPSDFNGS
jgi:hypothetical protein